MNAAELETSQASDIGSEEHCYVSGLTPVVMTKIYSEEVNLVVLQRSLDTDVSDYCQQLLESKSSLNLRVVINPEKLPYR